MAPMKPFFSFYHGTVSTLTRTRNTTTLPLTTEADY